MNQRLAVVREFFAWKDPVLDKDLIAAPGSPSRGDRYIVASGATGVWSTHDNSIAIWDGLAWFYHVPKEGWVCRTNDDNVYWVYTGSVWTQNDAFLNDKFKADATDPTAGYADSKVDGTTIEVDSSAHKLRIKDLGVTATKINSDVAGDGIVKNGGSGALDINVDNATLNIVTNVVKVADDGIGPTQLNETQNYTFTGTLDITGGDITVPDSPASGASAINKDYVMSLLDGLDWQESVLDRYDPTTALPSPLVEGARYLATATANTWTKDYIYEYRDSAWVEIIPDKGFALLVEDEDSEYVFNGTAWALRGGTTQHNNLSGLQGGQASEYYHLTNAQHTGLTSGGDASAYHNHDGQYFTETELGATASNSSGGHLIGIPTLPNLGNADNVEDAFAYLNTNWTTITQDKLSAVSSNDSTPGYLNGKLIGTANLITLTENNDGADETLQISVGSFVFNKNTDTLDSISNGSTYGKVLLSDIYNGHVTRLEDATSTLTVLQGRDAYNRRGVWDADYESIVFNV